MNNRPVDFDAQLQAALPELRRYARHMTNSRDEAEEALSDGVEAVLSNWTSYRPDGNFVRWCKLTIRSKASWNRQVATRHPHIDLEEETISEMPAQEHRAELSLTLRNAEGLRYGGREVVLSALGYNQIDVGNMVGVTGPRVCQRVKAARSALRAAA